MKEKLDPLKKDPSIQLKMYTVKSSLHSSPKTPLEFYQGHYALLKRN